MSGKWPSCGEKMAKSRRKNGQVAAKKWPSRGENLYKSRRKNVQVAGKIQSLRLPS